MSVGAAAVMFPDQDPGCGSSSNLEENGGKWECVCVFVCVRVCCSFNPPSLPLPRENR